MATKTVKKKAAKKSSPKKAVKKKAAASTEPVLHISLTKTDGSQVFQLELLDAKGAEFIGFGTFVMDPKRVTITQEALQLAKQQPYRHGLQGIEFFGGKGGPAIAYGAQTQVLLVHPSQASVHDNNHLNEFQVV